MNAVAIRSMLTAMLCTGFACPSQAAEAPASTHTPTKLVANLKTTDRASMVTMQIPSHGTLMNALVYVAAGAGPHPAVILLHGFPGNERNLDLAQDMRRAGWDVLYFNYPDRGERRASSPLPMASKTSPPHSPICANRTSPKSCGWIRPASC
jgi:predicted alpha/beta-fold hydrolase